MRSGTAGNMRTVDEVERGLRVVFRSCKGEGDGPAAFTFFFISPPHYSTRCPTRGLTARAVKNPRPPAYWPKTRAALAMTLNVHMVPMK